jgi:predicted tellurium resistance membrane protein TerC
MYNQFPIPLPPLPNLPYIPPGILYLMVGVLAVLLIMAAIRMLSSVAKDFPAALAIIGLVVVFVIGVWLVFGNFNGILQGFQQLTSPIFRWK